MRTLYRAARVHTTWHPRADALIVDDDVITWVGPAAEAGPSERDADRVVDLGPCLVTPAFVDAHTHVTETGLLLGGIDLAAARSVGEVLDLVAAAAARGDAPILGHGWDETLLAERRPPTRAELDRAGRGAAVYLSRVDVHSAVISSALAAVCGADGTLGNDSRESNDSRERKGSRDGWDDDGRVERDAHHAARAATRDTLTPGARRRAQLAALHAAAAAGLAAVHEMSAPHVASEEDLRSLLTLVADTDQVLPDVVPYWGELVSSPEQARAVVERVGVRLVGLAGDLTVDGSVGSRTAAYRDDYADAPGHRGHQYLTAEQVRDHVAACTRAGLQAGFHVIGDAAVRAAVRGFRRAAGQVGIAAVRAARHRLEHVEAIDADGIRELADLGVVASVQPAFDAAWGGSDGMYATRLGPARAQAMNPFGALTRAGVALALGSDSPVTPFDPWGAVRACVAHHVPGQRLDAATAVAAHTVGGWRSARIDRGGVIAVGVPASFAAWDVEGPLGADGLPVLDGDRRLPRCRLTVSRGRILHDAR